MLLSILLSLSVSLVSHICFERVTTEEKRENVIGIELLSEIF